MAERWKVSGKVKAKFGDISWKYSYVVTFHPDKCTITLRPKIQLKFPSGFDAAKKKAHIRNWTKAITKAFNGKWKVVPVDPSRCEQCKDGIKIRVRVKFVTSWTWSDDQEVTIINEDKRSSMRKWYTGDKDFSDTGSGDGVVHEICHILGLEDEYIDEVNYPGKKEKDLPKDHKDGVMGNHHKPILNRHMEILVFNKAKVNDHLPCPTYKLAKQ